MLDLNNKIFVLLNRQFKGLFKGFKYDKKSTIGNFKYYFRDFFSYQSKVYLFQNEISQKNKFEIDHTVVF